MKRIIKSLAIAAVSALAFISCSREQNPISKDNGIHFTIRTSENPQVKSFIENNLDGGGTYTPKWSKGDELAMFVGTINENTKPTGTLTNLNETGNEAKFDGIVTGLPKEGSFKSFAPASAFATGYNSGNVGVTLKDVQNPSSLTIDEACDILVAKESTYLADASGEVAIYDLFFKRMFSVVKVALKGPASLNGEKVSKFSLSAPEGTVLTGRAAINLSSATIDKWNISNNTVTATYTTDAPGFGGEYPDLDNVVWFVVNPGTIEPGAKVVFAGETANYTFSKEVTLSKALTFPESQLAVINLKLAEENCTKKAAASWIATDLADITATDEVVITMAKGDKVYAMTSDKGTTDNPQAVAVTVKEGKLTAGPEDNLVWNIANDKGNLTIYPNGLTDKWLYSASSGTDVKVGNSKTNNIFTLDTKTKYLYNVGTKRYLGVYKTSDWRAYASATGTSNIANQTLCFYVKGGPIDNTRPTLSVDQTSKVWAADATDAFVVKVTVNSEGGDWTVTPETLSWATIAVDKAAGTITVTPNGANEKDTANEATLTVTHTTDVSLTKEITLKQNAAGGEATKTYTLTFGKDFSDDKVNDYTSTWDASRDGFTWTMVNWNNYNAYVGPDPNKPANWTYIRAGRKNYASVATITTKTAIPEAISTVTMTIDEITTTYVNSIKLEVLSADGNTVETISGKAQKGDCVFKITRPQTDCKYKITVDCQKNKNGFVQVSKVVYTNN